jgi:hypothetical protein
MMYRLRVYYSPSSTKTDELIRGICYPGQKTGAGTYLPTNTRDLEFQFQFALDAAVSKVLLEKSIPEAEVEIEIEDDSPFSEN